MFLPSSPLKKPVRPRRSVRRSGSLHNRAGSGSGRHSSPSSVWSVRKIPVQNFRPSPASSQPVPAWTGSGSGTAPACPLRYQGPQKQAPAPPPDPHLIQAPPIIRADGPQPDPDPSSSRVSVPPPLHLPTLPKGCPLLPTPLFYPMPPVKTCLPPALLPAASLVRWKIPNNLLTK